QRCFVSSPVLWRYLFEVETRGHFLFFLFHRRFGDGLRNHLPQGADCHDSYGLVRFSVCTVCNGLQQCRCQTFPQAQAAIRPCAVLVRSRRSTGIQSTRLWETADCLWGSHIESRSKVLLLAQLSAVQSHLDLGSIAELTPWTKVQHQSGKHVVADEILVLLFVLAGLVLHHFEGEISELDLCSSFR